jgi:hypothetical protein
VKLDVVAHLLRAVCVCCCVVSQWPVWFRVQGLGAHTPSTHLFGVQRNCSHRLRGVGHPRPAQHLL